MGKASRHSCSVCSNPLVDDHCASSKPGSQADISEIREIYHPEISCQADVATLEKALETITSLLSQDELSPTMTEEQTHLVRSSLIKQQDMLEHSITRSKPHVASYPINFLHPAPFREESLWSPTWSDEADLYSALATTKSSGDAHIQKALVGSYEILRNMFRPTASRREMRSLLEQDTERLGEAWALETARAGDDEDWVRTRKAYRASRGEAVTGQDEQEEKWAEEDAAGRRENARHIAGLYNGARLAIRSLHDSTQNDDPNFH